MTVLVFFNDLGPGGHISYPRRSVYGIFTYTHHKVDLNER